MLSKNYDSKLLCTFSYPNELEATLELINNYYTVLRGKVYVLSLADDDQLALTYNVEVGNIKSKLSNTIALHRDKENDVLYTIDAVEQLNKNANGSQVDWRDYKSSIILTRNGSLNVIGTKLKKIENLK